MKDRKPFFWVAVIFLGGFGSVMLALSMGRVYQTYGTSKDFKQFQALGQIVDIGGEKLHLWCRGDKGPTVLLESGVGAWSIFWKAFFEKTPLSARVCTYDRAGYGWSGEGPEPRTVKRIADEAVLLLKKAELSGPYYLVGQGQGAAYVQAMAEKLGDEVRGVLWINPILPEFLNTLPPALQKMEEFQMESFDFFSTLAKYGVLRASRQKLPEVGLPENLKPLYRMTTVRPEFYETWISETKGFRESESHSFSAPLWILASENPFTFEDTPPEFPVEEVKGQWKTFLNSYSRAKKIWLESGSLYLQNEAPEKILETLRSFLQSSAS